MPGLAALLVGIALLGMRVRMGDVVPQEFAMVTPSDSESMSWIRDHTPAQSRFLVNSFFAYGGSVIVGSDAGWWLPLLTQRANTVPPLNYGTEQGVRPDYREWVNELAYQVLEHGATDPAVMKLLQDRGITHAYVGQQQGRVGYDGPGMLDVDLLMASPYYELIYKNDRVHVFEIVY
jgi:hypothetical protein